MQETKKAAPRRHPLTGKQKCYLAVKYILDFLIALCALAVLLLPMAVVALKNKEVERIVLTRPAVEAGERLGFLPGDLQSKIDPYLRPLYDALFEMLGPENYARPKAQFL